MNFPKLFQKKNGKDEDSSGKVQRIGAAKRAASKTPSAKTVKPKRTEGAKKPARKSDEPRFAWVDTARQYLREVAYEMRKVVWPSKKETIGSTTVVLAIVAICGVFLGAVDYVLSRLVRMLVG